MKMTKKALTAMIAASIAATTLPAAAMVSNLTNTLTTSNSAGTNNTTPQDANTAPQNTATAPAAAPETSTQTAASTPAVQADPSPKSMFFTEDVDNGVAITGFNPLDAHFTPDVVIPPTIDSKPVVSLKNERDNYICMAGATQITSLDTSNCTSLSIGHNAFYECRNLTSINLSGCTYIGNEAFGGCSGITITSVDLSNCTYIGNYAFVGCNITSSIDLSNCILIASGAFFGCSDITNVTWSSTQKTIPDSCFKGCKSLKTFNSKTEFNLSDITSIGDSAFYDCSGITGSVDLSSCTSIGKEAFFGCPNLIPTISTKATAVGSGAFNACPYVTIQADSEDALASYCFDISANSGNLQGLSAVKKLASITNITNMPKGLSYDPASIILDESATYYLVADSKSDYTLENCQVEAAYKVTLKSITNGKSDSTSIRAKIPITITIDNYNSANPYTFIVDNAFNSSAITPTGTYNFTDTVDLSENTSIVALVSVDMFYTEDVEGGVAITGFNTSVLDFNSNVVIPPIIDDKNVVRLKNNNDNGCMLGADHITSLDLSNCESVAIDDAVFKNCTNLTSANLAGCTSVGNQVFANCSDLLTANLPNCTAIPSNLFEGCTQLMSVDLSSCTSIGTALANHHNLRYANLASCTSVTKDTFDDCSGLSTVVLTHCTSVGDDTFKDRTVLETVNLSDCTSIGENAFYNCKNLTTINLGSCNSIDGYAFYNCIKLTNINLQNCISVGEAAFMGCTNLNSIDLSGCTSIGDSAFYLCKGLNSVDLRNCNSIGYAVFYSCSNLASINLSSCTSIGDYAFNDCRALTSVDLSHCTSIGEKAFADCFNLKPVISTNTQKVGTDAFSNVSYVTITAENEKALENYCVDITVDNKLSGLFSAKKIAILSDNTDGISINFDISSAELSSDFTYYFTASVNDDYAIDNYHTVVAYDVSIKKIANGSSTSTAMSGNLPLSIGMPIDSYDVNATYYLSTDTNTPITLTENDGYYTYSYTVAFSDAKINTIALISQNPVSNITVKGDQILTYGDTVSTTYTAIVEPDNAKQTVTWSSSNPDVLKFEDENSGTATIVGAGEATITATATDGSGETGTLKITVNKATPTITLSDKKEDYTGSPIEMSGAEVTLVNNETYTGEITYTYYSDADCKNQLEGAPTNVGTYYVKASVPEQNNYAAAESDPATLTITPIEMVVSATGFDGSYDGQPHSISVTERPDGTTVQYYEGDYSTVEDITWLDKNPVHTNAGNYTVSYKVTDPNRNYNEVKGIATINISQADVSVPTAAPELDSKTSDSITLKTVEDGTTQQGDAYSVEYGIDKDGIGTIEWQDTTTFTNLERMTEYTFYIRNHITDTSKVANYTENGYSSASQGVKIATYDVTPPAIGEGYTINYKKETITIQNGYEVATNQRFDESVKLKNGGKIAPGDTIYVRYVATADKPASVGTENKIAPRPEAPTEEPVITQTAKMLQVTNAVDSQQYKFKKNDGPLGDWQDSSVYIDDDMQDGDTYTVTTRFKATDTSFASEEGSSGSYVAKDTPKNSARLDGDKTGENWIPSDGTTYNDGYNIPIKLYIEKHPVYQVQLDWGDMALVYDVRSSSKGWGDSFDGENNIITVTNQSSEVIDATLSLDITETNLGFSPQLVAQNAIENDVTNPSVSNTVKQLASGNSGNAQSAYINLEHENDQPSTEYNSQTNIGAITVTIQKSDSDKLIDYIVLLSQSNFVLCPKKPHIRFIIKIIRYCGYVCLEPNEHELVPLKKRIHSEIKSKTTMA